MNKVSYSILYAVGSLLMGGCESIGPGSVKKVHYEYNDAIAKTANEQLLLNIVRLKYRDNPYFLEVTSVAENRKFTTRIGPSNAKIGLGSGPGHHEIGIAAYSEIFQNPTVTYMPLQGENFTRRLLSPIPLAVVLNLIQAGWNLKRVFNLCIERVNNIDNASSASGPTPTEKPTYESFAKTVDLMDVLYDQRHLLIGLNSKNSKELILKFTASNQQSQKLKALLGLDPNGSEFRFSFNFLDSCDNSLIVQTRSIMEVLFYLSHAVCVSEEDIEAGLVTTTRDQTGTVFDWKKYLSGEWITINCAEAKNRPQNAFISILYRGKWFYIADNDLNSKSTFMFLTYLFNLQSGDSKAFAPTLMISTN